ncbi:MAG: ribonuclease HI family protein [Candidatus Omnitrophica bacterium]|nr:ribonuclease HI family protein [Candidatus Omnitrophota bacterium]
MSNQNSKNKKFSNGVKKLLLYVDGGARGNPGPAGIGVVISNEKGKKLKEFNKFIGVTTNNIAEYNAVIYGLQEALIEKADEVELNLDSELVAQQLKGEYRVKNPNIRPLFEQARHLISGFKKIDIKHIDREKNKEADKLVNKAINLGGLL